ncbi:hypothetical protein MVEN_00655500 [Mycena venus]|uniref:Uncharacterized protein n=1 Tax=Mycena venus TaxID=2733690 RepID=A0A8H6YQK0_9AGAR|nr:hypothetical protein MVEN_00655500 [Mycena venus]
MDQLKTPLKLWGLASISPDSDSKPQSYISSYELDNLNNYVSRSKLSEQAIKADMPDIIPLRLDLSSLVDVRRAAVEIDTASSSLHVSTPRRSCLKIKIVGGSPASRFSYTMPPRHQAHSG